MKALNKQERIEKLVELTTIERDGTGLYAIVPSLTSNKKYFIDINERTFALGACQCIGTQNGCTACQHIIAVGVIIEASRQAVLDRVCAHYAHTVETVCTLGMAMEEAQSMMGETPDETAAIDGAMAEEEDWQGKLAMWHEKEAMLSAAYEISGHEMAARKQVVNHCEFCGKLSKSGWCGC